MWESCLCCAQTNNNTTMAVCIDTFRHVYFVKARAVVVQELKMSLSCIYVPKSVCVVKRCTREKERKAKLVGPDNKSSSCLLHRCLAFSVMDWLPASQRKRDFSSIRGLRTRQKEEIVQLIWGKMRQVIIFLIIGRLMAQTFFWKFLLLIAGSCIKAHTHYWNVL